MHTQTYTFVRTPHGHPLACPSCSCQEHPLSARLWLPASVLVIVILPDLLARSWRQESPCLPSTSASQLPPTPRIIQSSCCKVPCLLPPTRFTLASSVVLDLERKKKKALLFLAAFRPLHGVSRLDHTNLITGAVPVLQQVDAEFMLGYGNGGGGGLPVSQNFSQSS